MNLKLLWTIASNMGLNADLEMLRAISDFQIDVVMADKVRDYPLGLALTDKQYLIPDGKDEAYIRSVLELCHRENINTVVPQFGNELVPLARNLNAFSQQGIKVLVSSVPEKLQIAENKKDLYTYFLGQDFIPYHYVVTSLEDMENAIFSLGYPYRPVVVKPTDGEGATGVFIISAEKQNPFNSKLNPPLLSWHIFKEYLREMAMPLPELMVMEYLPGDEYSVDCVAYEGRDVVIIPRQRLATAGGVATHTRLEENEEIIDMARYIISALQLSYNINMQFRYTEEDELKLLEINPRVSGSMVANLGAGVNMLELSLKLAYDLPLPDIEVKWDSEMFRYYEQVFR